MLEFVEKESNVEKDPFFPDARIGSGCCPTARVPGARRDAVPVRG
jgi:hypothetical protein